jgi:hypothetical protein
MGLCASVAPHPYFARGALRGSPIGAVEKDVGVISREHALRPPSVATVRLVVAASVVLTAFHFTDNAVALDTYPKPSWQPSWFAWVVALSWPLFTAIGVLGYRWYRDGDYSKAHPALIVYSYTGLVSLGHFIYGSPSELTTRGVVSVLIDAVAGSAVLAVALRSILARRGLAAGHDDQAPRVGLQRHRDLDG